MGKKIFVSYKYKDDNVYKITTDWFKNDTVRDYVDVLEQKFELNDNIYVGEHDGEDLSKFKDVTIKSILRDKIFCSTITIVLISPNMNDKSVPEDDQWIPWEISYSLKNPKRDGRTSSTNGLICVVLPDKNNRTDYYFGNPLLLEKRFNTNVDFEIIQKNRNNLKNTEIGREDYIITVVWDVFLKNVNQYITEAENQADSSNKYNIVKEV